MTYPVAKCMSTVIIEENWKLTAMRTVPSDHWKCNLKAFQFMGMIQKGQNWITKKIVIFSFFGISPYILNACANQRERDSVNRFFFRFSNNMQNRSDVYIKIMNTRRRVSYKTELQSPSASYKYKLMTSKRRTFIKRSFMIHICDPFCD